MFVVFISIQSRDELISLTLGILKLALKHISNTVYFPSFFIIIPSRCSYYIGVCQELASCSFLPAYNVRSEKI